MSSAKIAVIGGSGLYEMPGVEPLEEIQLSTPYGSPSDLLIRARAAEREVIFLPRHGRGHRLNPSQVPSRANIFALKQLGVEQIISISAVGSLKEDIQPRELFFPDQLIDRTKCRPATFFDEIAMHVGFAEPFCPEMTAIFAARANALNINAHNGGTYVCMEGPLFSTKAESAMHRAWGASVIGMTALPEAKLAREAEICYATICLVTDYDVWHEELVSVELVVENLNRALSSVKILLQDVIANLPEHRNCGCSSALKNALISDPALIPPDKRRQWSIFLDKYLN